jgi:hypothetical protein
MVSFSIKVCYNVYVYPNNRNIQNLSNDTRRVKAMKNKMLKRIIGLSLTFSLVVGVVGAGTERSLKMSADAEVKICPELL